MNKDKDSKNKEKKDKDNKEKNNKDKDKKDKNNKDMGNKDKNNKDKRDKKNKDKDMGNHGGNQKEVSSYMVLADIYSADKSTQCTLVTNPVSTMQAPSSAGSSSGESVLSLAPQSMTSRNLTGSTVASGNLLINLENETGVYFIFQDLSVRSEGAYALEFSFSLLPIPVGPPSSVLATVFSEPFTIYAAKRFPGMTESTVLSKCFASQGIKIPIRKEPRISRSKRPAEEQAGITVEGEVASESDDDDDGPG
ncbi:hypothetical protein BGZ65_010575 [Modicella reniformis]|uniref:Velvet domain-containing protein n=1 Tax=Modicella reniformis TaxID=1440133 RepID=A0A9P6LTF3_9FUNG|nr:hypothetical protein BGZ65_010575 [Modicella reniformis]